MQQHLVIFAKEPKMGQVKTRLGRDIGKAAATNFYRQNLKSLCRRLGADGRWHLWLAVTPDHAPLWPGIPAGTYVIGQGPGDLGQRMDRVMQGMPAGPVVLIGSDIPHVQPRHIARAFEQIRRHDVVIGPAGDGGYWLIGMRRRPIPRGGFDKVDWSSGMEMFQTLNNLTRWDRVWTAGLHDVDDGDDWRQWRKRTRHR